MLERLQAHLAARLAATPVREQPFPHVYIEEAWPQDIYDAMLAGLPSDAGYEAMAPPYSERLALNLTPDTAAGLSPPWPAVEDWLHSQVLVDLLAGVFSPHLAAYSADRSAQIQKYGIDNDVEISGRSMLARDYAHYAIGPHTDSPGKFVVGIFYLSKDNAFEAFGTSFYRHKAGLKIWKSPHMDRSDFDLVETFPNRPNSVLFFLKTDDSFHGVEAADYPNTGRDVLFWMPEIGAGRGARRLRLPKRTFVPALE
jgi:hypothetical protein